MDEGADMRPKRQMTDSFSSTRNSSFPIIAAAEIFFQPDIGADEEIPAAHFADLELGHTMLPVLPGNRHDGPRVAANDRLERKFDRQVEMGRQERPAALDDGAAIGLEGIGRVIERDVEADAHEKIRDAIDEELNPRVVDDLATLDEPAAEDAFPALVEQPPVAHGV